MTRNTPKNDTGRDEGEKITDGLNDRPRNATIAQTGGGVPDDSGKAVETSPEQEKRIAERLKPS